MKGQETYTWTDLVGALRELANHGPAGLRPLMIQAADRIAELEREAAIRLGQSEMTEPTDTVLRPPDAVLHRRLALFCIRWLESHLENAS
jgi:ribulose-5-phosphate 4-epimerase/fuculose-1-phosphate aldolase